MAYQPVLCLDFDGVIHSYTSGWKGARNIPDPPTEGVFAFIAGALDAGYDVVIHSSRARHFGGINAMRPVATAACWQYVARLPGGLRHRERSLRSVEAFGNRHD